MKKYSLLFIVVLLLMAGFAQKSLAQDWTTYAKAIDDVADGSTYVYFYNVDQGKFLTTGGTYGVEGIFANVGMRFQIVKNGTDNYSVISTVENAAANLGSYMAFANSSLFLDRAEHETNWQFNTTTTTNEYTMSENSSTKHKDFVGYYIGLSTDNKRLIPAYSSSSATKWLLITEADYRQAISNQEAQFIDVSGLIRDPGFVRNSKDVTSWIWTDDASTGHSLGMTSDVGSKNGTDDLATQKGAFYAGEIDGESNTLTQTISNLSPGTYKVTCQGFYYKSDNSENSCAVLFANDNKVLLKTITDDAKTSYETIRKADRNSYVWCYNQGYLKDNVAAAEYLADKDKYSSGSSTYENEVYVRVVSDDGTDTGKGTLKLGISKTCTDGQAFFDNFKLYYCGTQEMYLSANNTDATNIDQATYQYPVRLSLRRAFTKDAWNAIVLPMNLSGDQVKAAFSTKGDAKLSKLVGINPKKTSQILFEKVDLDKEGLTAGTCYVVYVTKDPDVKKGETYTYKYNNVTTTKDGPLYQIEGVTQTAYTNTKASYTTEDGKINFVGYYYKLKDGAATGSYIMGDGKMYWLDQASTIYGTTWVLTDNGTGAKQLSISINGVEEDVATGIAGLTIDNGAQTATQKVFNLNGQMVKSNSTSLENLPKGIYIVNGKKYVVR
jgi:hypothetical protein